jgi:hypothetical protein
VNTPLVAGEVAEMRVAVPRAPGEDGFVYFMGCADDPMAGTMGSVSDGDNTFVGGNQYVPQAVGIRIVRASAARITVEAGDSLVIMNAAGEEMKVYLPALDTTEDVMLYPGADGATYHDAGLTSVAQPAPAAGPINVSFQSLTAKRPAGYYRDPGTARGAHWGDIGAREFGW